VGGGVVRGETRKPFFVDPFFCGWWVKVGRVGFLDGGGGEGFFCWRVHL